MSCRGLTRGGRHQTLDNGLKFKEITVGGDSEARRRFIVVFNYQTGIKQCKSQPSLLLDVPPQDSGGFPVARSLKRGENGEML